MLNRSASVRLCADAECGRYAEQGRRRADRTDRTKARDVTRRGLRTDRAVRRGRSAADAGGRGDRLRKETRRIAPPAGAVCKATQSTAASITPRSGGNDTKTEQGGRGGRLRKETRRIALPAGAICKATQSTAASITLHSGGDDTKTEQGGRPGSV